MTEEIEKRKSIKILMVEDSPANAFLTQKILAESNKAFYKVSTVKDGIETLSYLRNRRAPKPDMLLLDFNLPRRHGFDFPPDIKTAPELKTISVCILAASDSEADLESGFRTDGDSRRN